MANVDLIANMLTEIRNAVMVRKEFVAVPASKINNAILGILKEHGYIENFRAQEGAGAHNKVKVYLKYGANKKPALIGLKRISRQGLRVYSGCSKMGSVLRGFGIAVVSTSKGLMTDKEAKEQKLGGEIICYAW